MSNTFFTFFEKKWPTNLSIWTVISKQLTKYRLSHTHFDNSLLNQNYNVGWFLLARYVDLLRVWSLHISWNRCNTFFSTTIGGYLLHLSMSSLWGRERFLRCDILREKIDQKIFLLYKQITEIVYCSTFL